MIKEERNSKLKPLDTIKREMIDIRIETKEADIEDKVINTIILEIKRLM